MSSLGLGFDLDPRSVVLLGALGLLGVAAALCMIRVVRGPSHFDRVMALDCLLLDVVGALLVLSMLFETGSFLDSVLTITLLGFLTTITLAAYLEGSLAA